MDFHGSAEAARVLARRISGATAKIPRFDDATPNSGVVTFKDSAGRERLVDFLKVVGGISDDEQLHRTAIPVTVAEGVEVRVMNPLFCLESRAYNVIHIPESYDTPHCMQQLRVSVICAREFVTRRGQRCRSGGRETPSCAGPDQSGVSFLLLTARSRRFYEQGRRPLRGDRAGPASTRSFPDETLSAEGRKVECSAEAGASGGLTQRSPRDGRLVSGLPMDGQEFFEEGLRKQPAERGSGRAHVGLGGIEGHTENWF